MMGTSTRRAFVTALVACAAACGLFPDLGDLGGGDAGSDVTTIDSPLAESGTDAGGVDAPADATSDVVDAANDGSAACPSGVVRR